MIRESVLEELLRLPTAPFYEAWVLEFLAYHLEEAGVPVFVDPIGNMIAGVDSEEAYLKLVETPSPEPVRIFVAHSDHPGFHVQKAITPKKIAFKWHGGAPVKLLKGARVGVASYSDPAFRYGKMDSVKLTKTGKSIESGTIVLDEALTPEEMKSASKMFGSFAFKDSYFKSGTKVYSKAADDLIGCYAMLELCIRFYKDGKKSKVPFLALFTRAEEVGFVGMIGHIKLGWLENATRPIVFVSLETSRTLPGADIGKGPVVRMGDRMGVFHANGTQHLTLVAERVLKGKYQKRIMDGGTCEASVAMASGFPAIGISVPLGNYHNQSFQGGPESRGAEGPAPEFVDLKDLEGMMKLCIGLVDQPFTSETPWKARLLEFEKRFKEYEKLL